MSSLYAAIEAGGTKFVCAIGSGPGDLAAETRIPTTTPAATLAAAIEFFQTQQARLGPLAAVGIGAFGPLDLRRDSPTYGYITSTPKPGWANVDLVGRLKQALQVPVGFDTDVNAAALGEWRWGAGQSLDNLIYLTVGTGIGGGGLVGGQLIHGLIHPEMGHVAVAHDRLADPFPGICLYHGYCLEGLASGPAIERRWGKPAEQLPDDHPAWPLEAHYLAHGLATFIYVLSPQRIVLGGGVMAQSQLFRLIRAEVLRLLNAYMRSPWLGDRIDDYIVPPALGGRAGVLGALALAQAAAQ
jgi:fructokinase